MSMSKPIIISIEGNIGSGKSTLLKNLKHFITENANSNIEMYKNILFLREPVDQWEDIKDKNGDTMLSKFYADQEKYSFPFQMMAYISRLSLLKEAVEKNPNCVIITERSLYTDKFVFAKMLYDIGKIEDVNFAIYNKWFDTFANDFPVEKVVYVNADPEICDKRIHRRCRNGESNIPLSYLNSCHDYHNVMINEKLQLKEENLLVIDGNLDIYENNENLDKMLKDVNEFLNFSNYNKLK